MGLRLSARIGVASLVALLVTGLIAAAGFLADSAERRWVQECEADRGSVESITPLYPNYFLVESADPVLQCRDADGRVLRVRH